MNYSNTQGNYNFGGSSGSASLSPRGAAALSDAGPNPAQNPMVGEDRAAAYKRATQNRFDADRKAALVGLRGIVGCSQLTKAVRLL